MSYIPDPNAVFPNAYGTTCFIKNVVTAPNITIGDYTYYDDDSDPTGFERNNVLFNWPEFGDHLIIGKFCAIAQGVGGENTGAPVPTAPTAPEGGHRGGQRCMVWPGVPDSARNHHRRRGHHRRPLRSGGRGAPLYGGGREPGQAHPARFDAELTQLLLRVRWWDLPPEQLTDLLPVLCSPDLERVRTHLRALAGPSPR